MRHLTDDNRNYISSALICKQCGHLFPIPRINGRKRPKGHIKHIWCPHCKQRTEHIEE